MKDDGLPRYLCESCITIVTQFYNFQVLYEQNVAQLRSLLQTKEESQSVEGSVKTNEIFGNDEEGKEDVKKLESASITIKEEILETEFMLCPPAEEETEEDTAYLDETCISDENESIINQDVVNLNTKTPRIIEKEDGTYEERTKYECKDCGDTFLFTSGIISHMFKTHGLRGINPDSYGEKIYVKLNKHPVIREQFLSPKIQVKAPETSCNPKCMMCKQIFANAEDLKAHMTIHRTYVCEVCGASFIKKSYLDDHKDAHSPECKYVCKFCNKSFKRRTVLVKHKKLHTHPRQCVCSVCGKRFNDNGTLKTHTLLVHIKERNFKCNICNLTFALKPTLDKHIKRHMRRENGERDFICDQCGMKYRDKSSLNRHKATQHSGNNIKRKCEDCGKEYTSTTNLMKHKRSHHKDIPSVIIDGDDGEDRKITILEVPS